MRIGRYSFLRSSDCSARCFVKALEKIRAQASSLSQLECAKNIAPLPQVRRVTVRFAAFTCTKDCFQNVCDLLYPEFRFDMNLSPEQRWGGVMIRATSANHGSSDS